MNLRGQEDRDSGEGSASDALSGTFPMPPYSGAHSVAHPRAGAREEAESFVRALLLGAMHQQSSPLGALLANLSMARDDLRSLARQSREVPSAVAGSLAEVQQDVDDALQIVERLRVLGDSLKRLAAQDGLYDWDLTQLVPLAAAVANVFGGHRFTVRCRFEDGPSSDPDPHPSWMLRINGLRFIWALAQITSELVGSSDEPDQRISIVVERGGEAVRIWLQPHSRSTNPNAMPFFSEGNSSSRDEFCSRAEALLRDTNVRVGRESLQPGGRVVFESSLPASHLKEKEKPPARG